MDGHKHTIYHSPSPILSLTDAQVHTGTRTVKKVTVHNKITTIYTAEQQGNIPLASEAPAVELETPSCCVMSASMCCKSFKKMEEILIKIRSNHIFSALCIIHLVITHFPKKGSFVYQMTTMTEVFKGILVDKNSTFPTKFFHKVLQKFTYHFPTGASTTTNGAFFYFLQKN